MVQEHILSSDVSVFHCSYCALRIEKSLCNLCLSLHFLSDRNIKHLSHEESDLKHQFEDRDMFSKFCMVFAFTDHQKLVVNFRI